MTGRPPGRPKGAINRASRETRERAAASGMLPHEFLLAITRGETIDGYTPSFAERLDAAKAAAPFFAPKMSAIEASFTRKPVDQLTDEELELMIHEEAGDLIAAMRAGKLQ